MVQLLEALQKLDMALSADPGHKLFTILVIDWIGRQHRRIYSSSPSEYPCGSAKSLQVDNEFFRKVVLEGASRICRNREECRAAFSDYEIFEAMGCSSAVNVPIILNGQTYGSLNLLHAEGWYRPEMIAGLTRHAENIADQLCSEIPALISQ